MPHPAPYGAPADRILFGAAYYAEYQPVGRLEQDLDLMVEAHFSVIRVGESVWSTWEPRDGVFELDWLQPVLDGAHSRGISVVLGTPTYAAPPWLQRKHPEIAAERRTGQRIPWGARQEIDYSSPAFLFHAERVIRKVVSRYADHPAVIGFQVDNEPGLELFHNRGAFLRFVDTLKDTYGDVETLNREWGLTYWSHRISDWAELWVPDGNTLPQYDLAWRRFQSTLTNEFITWQADIVREYSRDGQFVMTCIAYNRPGIDDAALTSRLDVTAGNPYYEMQDHLALDIDLSAAQSWASTGVGGLYRQADRMFSSRQERFLVTETNAQSIGGSHQNYPPHPGQLQQAALALVSRGASMIEYWHWHSLHFGTETYWGGILPHSQRPGRVYREIADIGETLAAIGPSLDGFVPDADVSLLYSTDSRWALEFFPPLATAEQKPDRQSYNRIFDAFYRGALDVGAQVRIVHSEHIEDLSPTELFAQHPVLVVPALYVASERVLQLLDAYARAGGSLVIGIRTGYGDEEARARAEVAPAFLSKSAGVWYDEFSNLDSPLTVTGSEGLAVSVGASATGWADGLVADEATVLARYEHVELGRFPAITTAEAGSGRVTVVGTVPNPELAADVMRWLVPRPITAGWFASDRGAVTVTSGVAAANRRVWFVHNWGSPAAAITVPHDVTDPITGDTHAAGSPLTLDPWSCLIVVDG